MKQEGKNRTSKQESRVWERKLENWVRQLLLWQLKTSIDLQRRIARLSPADQRRVWLFYVVGFSCCLSSVVVRPFLDKELSNTHLHWGYWKRPNWTGSWNRPLPAPALFAPHFQKFSQAFEPIHTPKAFHFPVLVRTPQQPYFIHKKIDSLCQP